MHSGFHDIPAGAGAEITSCTSNSSSCAPPLLLSINHHQILDTTTQQRLFHLHDHHHHFLPPHHHHYAAASSPYFPLNFKLGLNEFNDQQQHYRDIGSSSSNINNEDANTNLLRQHHPSLGMLHSWQQPHQDSPKQPRFWEGAEVSNENSSERQQQQDLEMSNQKDMSTKSRSLHFGELEAIYNNNNTTTIAGDDEDENPPVHVAIEKEEEEEASVSASLKNSIASKKRRKKKKKKKGSRYKKLFSPMTEFFGNLVKQVMDHQESLHKKFSEAIERLDEERRAREEAWRNRELAHLEEEAEARARERASATTREAIIVSYLEKITGQTIQLNPDISPTMRVEDLSVHR